MGLLGGHGTLTACSVEVGMLYTALTYPYLLLHMFLSAVNMSSQAQLLKTSSRGLSLRNVCGYFQPTLSTWSEMVSNHAYFWLKNTHPFIKALGIS